MEAANDVLVEELVQITDACTSSARRFREIPENILNYKEDVEKWSVLECIEHLNRYADYYLPEIAKAVERAKARGGKRVFKSGIIGNYFAILMKVKNGRMVKMKTPADKNPSGSVLTVAVIDKFLEQQETLKGLLFQASDADLTGVKVPISIAKFLKIRLGDTFRFFIYHIERHIFQAENALAATRAESAGAESGSPT